MEGNYLWCATGAGVVRWNLEDGTHTLYTVTDGLAHQDVTAIAVDSSGNKWFCTHWGGVSKYDGSTWADYTTAEGLASDDVTAIAIDGPSRIWFGTWGGGRE